MKHTAGPWNVAYKEQTGQYCIERSKGSQADLALIAATPEMFEVLQRALLVLNSFDSTNESEDCITDIEFVLKKVKGI